MQCGFNKQSQIFNSLSSSDSRFTICDQNRAAAFSKEGHNSVLVDVGLYVVSIEPLKNRICI